MNGTLKTDEVLENKIKYFIIEYIRVWNSYHVETSLRISLCLLYGRFLYDINSCCGNSKQTIITSLFDLYTELIMQCQLGTYFELCGRVTKTL